uniref:Uncharacterized protein n=1 Tax=Timspurckia oligopyrenoides TaxID=708627 RepID=A0A7S0ZFH0_9RHOD
MVVSRWSRLFSRLKDGYSETRGDLQLFTQFVCLSTLGLIAGVSLVIRKRDESKMNTINAKLNSIVYENEAKMECIDAVFSEIYTHGFMELYDHRKSESGINANGITKDELELWLRNKFMRCRSQHTH